MRERASSAVRRTADTARRASVMPAGQILLVVLVALAGITLGAGFVLQQYYQRDVVTSLFYLGADGWCDLRSEAIGIHCFGDYALSADVAARTNPWDEFLTYRFNYTAGGLLVFAVTGAIEQLVGTPRVGVLLYLVVMAAGIFGSAIWASARRPALERVIIVFAAALVSVPGLYVLDRGNSAGFIVPLALGVIVTASRGRWGIAVVLIILASLLKPQFAILALLPFAMRRWRYGALALGGGIVANLAAYLAWPADFPGTILQSIGNTLDYGSLSSMASAYPINTSFSRGLYLLVEPIQNLTGIGIADFVDDQQSRIGYLIVGLAVIAVLVLGRRLRPTTAGIVLLAAGSLFVAVSWMYYLVFAIVAAALLLRDPVEDGRGWLDRPASRRDRVAGIVVAVATAISLVHVPLPQFIEGGRVTTTAPWAAVAWLVAIVALLSTARRQPIPAEPIAAEPEPLAAAPERATLS